MAKFLISLVALLLFAGEADAQKKNEDVNFECRRIRDVKLEDIKSALVKNCNVDKPFSFSVTDVGVHHTVTICCHKIE